MAPYLATATLGRFDVTQYRLGSGMPVYLAVDPTLSSASVLKKLPHEGEHFTEQGWRFAAGEPASLVVGNLIFPPIVSPTALLIAVVLAVFKPWGRIRKASATQQDGR